jgi:hypothetical protein
MSSTRWGSFVKYCSRRVAAPRLQLDPAIPQGKVNNHIGGTAQVSRLVKQIKDALFCTDFIYSLGHLARDTEIKAKQEGCVDEVADIQNGQS